MTLEEFFKQHNKIALALSGGTDSSFLLSAGIKFGADIKPYFVKSQFQPEFELEDAKKLCSELNTELTILNLDVLESKDICANPENRCYLCKNRIFSALVNAAAKDGYSSIIDGTNASDSSDDRPGMKALEELKVLSPLRMCEITKDDVRRLSRETNLFTADKPSYACLATRIPHGQEITQEMLSKIEHAEQTLFSLGYSDLRVRVIGNTAKVQVPRSQLLKAVSEWDSIKQKIKCDFPNSVLDLKGR